MKYTVAALRFAFSALMLAAIARTFVYDATHGGDIWPWDWFGYFTNQNNLAAGFVLTLAGILLLRGRRRRWLEYARGAVTVYIFIVGSVYWTLLAPLGAPEIPWTNAVMHGVMPAYCLLDWLLIGDRAPLRYAKVWVIFPYAVVWLGVTLTRGASDGWAPYPFLDPASGYASVALYCAAIVVIAIIVAYAFWAASRFRGVLLRSATPARRTNALAA